MVLVVPVVVPLARSAVVVGYQYRHWYSVAIAAAAVVVVVSLYDYYILHIITTSTKSDGVVPIAHERVGPTNG